MTHQFSNDTDKTVIDWFKDSIQQTRKKYTRDISLRSVYNNNMIGASAEMVSNDVEFKISGDHMAEFSHLLLNKNDLGGMKKQTLARNNINNIKIELNHNINHWRTIKDDKRYYITAALNNFFIDLIKRVEKSISNDCIFFVTANQTELMKYFETRTIKSHLNVIKTKQKKNVSRKIESHCYDMCLQNLSINNYPNLNESVCNRLYSVISIKYQQISKDQFWDWLKTWGWIVPMS